MTNQNNAAQAAEKAIRAAITLLDGDMDHANAETMRALLSNLRAPVADKLPHWEEISAKLEREETLTPLELFIHENEPAGDEDTWRDQLAAALASASAAPQACPTDVCQAGKADGVLCANDECDRASGVRPASAPVADERAAFKKCHSVIIKALSSIARADGPDTRKADDPELLYRSPVMDDVVRIRVALDECSAALAGAPVAGEAVAWRVTHPRSPAPNWRDAARERPPNKRDVKQQDPDLILELAYAAPQASDAAQGTEHMAPGLGDVVLPRLPPITHKWAALISDSMARALENWARAYTRTAILADRQQRAGNADEYEKMRDVLQWIVDDAASGGVAKLRPQQEKRARAALSAQPAEEPATSAPSPAASQRQAMVPGSQESSNSHTDGGAVYA